MTSGVASRASLLKRNHHAVTTEQSSAKENASKLTLENSEAVNQLLNVTPPRELSEENEWEEVLISDGQILVKEAPGSRENVATKTPTIKSSVQPEVTLGTVEKDTPGPDMPPPTEGTSTSRKATG